ncbi:conserved hypothetical protein [Methanococcus vannielii SB]|uniref:4Fe-4S ferredoxin-type domain-containing protein n=1 Tax=Methanococcus vannielii (strain ATCC 35089 / DSM 1224 / JCM 13029 / OCM 148 / SB) TaxID=406327 RepID=A6US22_METVS|nr:GMC oxidoreductase [Methanococcus vannielii]ABR55294.1 conserved hypothetical protein [Methanococcus vannielii SB]
MDDVIIIGSGICGSTIFNELKKSFPEKKIRLIEKGNSPEYISEGKNVEIIHASSFGGAGMFSVGNAVRIDLPEFKISKKDKIYDEIERELNVSVIFEDSLNENLKKLLEMNFSMTPKFIDESTCSRCGLCAHVPCSSKWTPFNILKTFENQVKMRHLKGDILKDIEVLRISKVGDVFSIIGLNKKTGEIKVFESKKVVISAGGVNSPRILKTISKNEHVGKNLFVDTFVTVGGILKDCNLNSDVQMIVHKKYQDFIIAPHYSELLYGRISKFQKVDKKDVFGLMVKINDDNSGEVLENSVIKEMTMNDTQKLSEGVIKASKYLYDLGLENIYSTIPRGSHPGGTCALDKVVDKNLETEIKNLYVCDASVIPNAVGAPPILGLIAISKKFSQNLKNSF